MKFIRRKSTKRISSCDLESVGKRVKESSRKGHFTTEINKTNKMKLNEEKVYENLTFCFFKFENRLQVFQCIFILAGKSVSLGLKC